MYKKRAVKLFLRCGRDSKYHFTLGRFGQILGHFLSIQIDCKGSKKLIYARVGTTFFTLKMHYFTKIGISECIILQLQCHLNVLFCRFRFSKLHILKRR